MLRTRIARPLLQRQRLALALARRAASGEEERTRPGRTWQFQEQLPRLPVPAVKDTSERYRAAVRPLLSKKARDRTEQNVDWFKSSGRVAGLQKELHALDQASPTSWLEGFWDTMYLEQRSTLVVNTSPCFGLADPPFPAYSSPAAAQVERAAALVHAAAAWNQRLCARELEPDTAGGAALCMAQYGRLLGTSRLPRRGRDELVTNGHARTVAVLRDGRVFVLAVEDEQERLLGRAQLAAALQLVLDAPPAEGADAPPCLLTAGGRDQWADARAALLVADRGNERALAALDNALFVLCLDREAPSGATALARQLLHAEGAGNRWYDKLQLVVCANGRAGFNMEHAPVDGHTLLRFASDVSAAAAGPAEEAEGAQAAEAAAPEELRWVVPAQVRAAAADAGRELAALVARTELATLEFEEFGKEAMKRCRLSPDGFVQMAFQLAYQRAFGKTVSTYESAMTKQFLHGRTETIRSVTDESRAHSTAFSAADAEAKAASAARLRAAVERHVQVSKDARDGKGVDRHLFVLFQLAKQQQARLPNHKIPELFTDPSYTTFCSNVLSTSNCGSDALSLFGFGPVHEDGLGVGYIINENSLSFTVTSFKEPAAAEFVKHLAEALRDQLAVAQDSS